MTNLNDYHVTDGVDDVLAEDFNRLIDSVIRGELSNIETLAANKTLVNADYPLQVLSPTAARDVTLPVIAAANHPFYIINVSATYALTVKNSGGSTIGTVAVSSSGSFASDGVTWHSFGGGGGIADGSVTLAKMADMATDSLIGRDTAGTGVPEIISVGSGLTLSSGVLSSTGGASIIENQVFN